MPPTSKRRGAGSLAALAWKRGLEASLFRAGRGCVDSCWQGKASGVGHASSTCFVLPQDVREGGPCHLPVPGPFAPGARRVAGRGREGTAHYSFLHGPGHHLRPVLQTPPFYHAPPFERELEPALTLGFRHHQLAPPRLSRL